MARRMDSGWRDGLLTVRHRYWGYEAPAPGLAFPMIEYDRGVPVAVISYIRRDQFLPTGRQVAATYRAFGQIYRGTGEQLPFFTVQYDARNWSYKVFGHNDAARVFLDTADRLSDVTRLAGAGWTKMTEQELILNLYRLRGRYAPILAPYGIDLSTEPWDDAEPLVPTVTAEQWPHQLMSARRRNFEPVMQTRMSWRNPCLDMDFAVVDPAQRLALVVDYKAPGAKIGVSSTNMQALSGLYTGRGSQRVNVPAMVVSYAPTKPQWGFRVHCLNHTARLHLSYVLGASGAPTESLADTIAGAEWVDVDESQWRAVLDAARDL